MAEWLYEEGIGENRAVLVDGDRILEAIVELPDQLRAGTILAGKLTDILVPGRRGLVSARRDAVLVEPLPPWLTQGQAVLVEITREAVAEPGKPKLARGRVTAEAEREAPTLAERIGVRVGPPAPGVDHFEAAGWSELIDEARSGATAFSGGELRMSLTPAMTLFDVDGALSPAELAVAGAKAAGRAIRRLGIAGSIGIDLPTLAARADRQRAAAAFDEVLPQPFERTAVNGFGFLQLVRRRVRPSLPEMVQWDSVQASARALLRRAERDRGVGEQLLIAVPPVAAAIETRTDWLEELIRRTGRAVRLQADPALTTFGGHVHSAAQP